MLHKPREREMLLPLHLKTQEPCWCFSVSASDSQPFGVGGCREEVEKKAGKRSPLLAGTQSVSAWVGRVAERAKQAPGISSVGVRMGWEGEGGGLNPKCKGIHCAWELTVSTYTWVCIPYDCTLRLRTPHSAILSGDIKTD